MASRPYINARYINRQIVIVKGLLKYTLKKLREYLSKPFIYQPFYKLTFSFIAHICFINADFGFPHIGHL